MLDHAPRNISPFWRRGSAVLLGLSIVSAMPWAVTAQTPTSTKKPVIHHKKRVAKKKAIASRKSATASKATTMNAAGAGISFSARYVPNGMPATGTSAAGSTTTRIIRPGQTIDSSGAIVSGTAKSRPISQGAATVGGLGGGTSAGQGTARSGGFGGGGMSGGLTGAASGGFGGAATRAGTPAQSGGFGGGGGGLSGASSGGFGGGATAASTPAQGGGFGGGGFGGSESAQTGGFGGGGMGGGLNAAASGGFGGGAPARNGGFGGGGFGGGGFGGGTALVASNSDQDMDEAELRSFSTNIKVEEGGDPQWSQVSLSFHKKDLHTALLLMGKAVKANIIISSSIEPEVVSCSFDHLSFDKALEVMLESARQKLTYRFDGKVFKVMKMPTRD